MTTIENIADEAAIDLLPAQRPIQTNAVEQLMLHAQAMATAKQLADALCDTDLVPAIYRGKPGNGAAAILYGAELGLNPIQSLQQIFVVHGTPAIYAKTAVALVKAKAGIVIQTVEDTDERVTVSATDPTTGQVEVSTWDIARASKAEYTRNALYQKNPRSMLWAKAAMEVCRRIAPDVLLGISYAREELELEQQPTVRRAPTSNRGVDGLRRALAPATEPPSHPMVADVVVEAEPEAPKGWSPATRRKWEKALLTALAEADCTDPTDLGIVVGELAGRNASTDVEFVLDDELRTAVAALDVARKGDGIAALVTDILNRAALAEVGADESGEVA